MISYMYMTLLAPVRSNSSSAKRSIEPESKERMEYGTDARGSMAVYGRPILQTGHTSASAARTVVQIPRSFLVLVLLLPARKDRECDTVQAKGRLLA